MSRALLAVVVCGAGCSLYDYGALSRLEPSPDGGGDAGVDAGSDAGFDAGFDAGVCPDVLSGQETRRRGDAGLPAIGAQQRDARYGQLLRRLTGLQNVPGIGMVVLRPRASPSSAFDATGAHLLLQVPGDNAPLVVFDFASGALTGGPRVLRTNTGSDTAWHPTRPGVLLATGVAGLGLVINEEDVATGVVTPHRDLSAAVRARFPDAGVLWNHALGAPSLDGKTWCLHVETEGYQALGFVAVDLETGAVLGSTPLSDRPIFTTTSAGGTHCIASFSTTTLIWPADFSTGSRALNPYLIKAVTTTTLTGTEVLVVNSADERGLERVDLLTGGRTTLARFEAGANWASPDVFLGPPGWVLATATGCRGSDFNDRCDGEWFDDALLAIELEGQRRVLQLADLRSSGCSGCGPSVALGPGSVLFSSTWDVSSTSAVSTFSVEAPACFFAP